MTNGRDIAGNDRRLSIATIASSVPMGAQAYERRIVDLAPSALASESRVPWIVRHTAFRSMRSRLEGDRRLPLGPVAAASPAIRRQLGRMLYQGDTVTHRMNLELPPAPDSDVVTIHDVVAWRYPDESPPVAAAAEEARRAAAVVCVSEFTANEVGDLLGVRDMTVIHNGVDEAFFDARPLAREMREQLDLPEEYVLHAGGAATRKNLQALAEAWPLIHRERPDIELVLSGPPHPRRTTLFAGLNGTRLVGRVAPELVPGLVAGARAVVVPSLYEGFGLPVLEAMAANVPVVVARTSSLPEVAGDAGILVPPTAAGITDGVLAATSGDSGVTALVAAGRRRASTFTWERSARGHARVWDEVR